MTETAGAHAEPALLTPDICVLGAGPGGYAIANTAAAFGVPVVLVERADRMAGHDQAIAAALSGLGVAARRARQVSGAAAFGITTGDVAIDFAAAQAHAAHVATTLAPNQSFTRLAALGVTVLKGDARFTRRDTVTVGHQTIRARRFVIATGSEPIRPPIAGLAGLPCLTEETLLGLARLPRRLLVLGGGASGVEIAQTMRRLGSEVALVCDGAILPGDDPEAVGHLRRALLRDGIELYEGYAVIRAESPRNRPRLILQDSDGAAEFGLDGSHLFLATRREPDIARLDPDIGGVRLESGRIAVDRSLRTSNRRILAIGDAIADAPSGPRDAHVEIAQANQVVRNILFRRKVERAEQAVPRLVRCEPEIASVGLAERDAKPGSVRVLRWPYSESPLAQAERRSEGMVKLLADTKGRVLGVTIAGARAGELIVPWSLAVAQRANLRDIADLAMPAATFSELSKAVAASFYTPLAAKPGLRRLIGFLRRFG